MYEALGSQPGKGVKGSNEDSAHPEPPHPDLKDIDNDVVFAEEREGWRGYVEWEDYPEKKALAYKIMKSHKFPPPPDFQLGPIPDTICSSWKRFPCFRLTMSRTPSLKVFAGSFGTEPLAVPWR